MSTTANNETLERIKKEVAVEFSAGNYESFWDALKVYGDKRMINELCERFARAVAEERDKLFMGKIDKMELYEAIDLVANHHCKKNYKEITGHEKFIVLELAFVTLAELRESDNRHLYTREQVISSIKDSLKEAAENAKGVFDPYGYFKEIDKSSITNEKNIKLL